MKKIYPVNKDLKRGDLFEKIFFKAIFSFLLVTVFVCMFQNAGAQIARRGGTTTVAKGAGASTTLTVNKPAGVVQGDVMIFVYSALRATVYPSITGWTVARQGAYVADLANNRQGGVAVVLYKVAGPSEPASYSFTVEAAVTAIGAMVAFSGVDVTGTTPFDAPIQILEREYGQLKAYAYPITTQTANAAVVMFVMNQDWRVYSGWQTDSMGGLSEIVDSHAYTSSNNDQTSIGAGWGTKPLPGSTGQGRASMDGNSQVYGLMLALKRNPPAPTITSFSPASGPVGTSVTITGTGFFADPSQYSVYFGAAKATVIAATLTSLTVTVPPGSTYENIAVTDLRYNKAAYTSKPFLVTLDEGALAFKPKTKVYEGFPNGITAADVDGDGLTDLVSPSDGNLLILPNSSSNGVLSFKSPVVLTVGSSPFAVAFKDIDGDDKADLIVLNKGLSNVSVFKNTSLPGNISFAAKQDFAVGVGPRMVAVSDMDGDGKADIVTANTGANTVSVLRNTSGFGVISFAAKVDYGTGTQPYWVRIGDIDGNGKADIVTANYGSANISVLRNTSTTPGTLAFAAKVNFTTGSFPRALALGDIDGDGKPDIAVGNYSGGTLSIFRNTSPLNSITMATRVDILASGTPTAVTIGDIDGDGKPDIAVTNEASNTVSLYKNNSSSGVLNIAAATDLVTPTNPEDVIICDINNDGKPDLAVTDIGLGDISVFTQVCNTPTITSVLPVQASPGSVVTISGSNFSSNGTVTFGGVSMPVTSWSKTSIQATLPANVYGGNIVVANQCLSTASVVYTIPPTITSFSPGTGPIGSSITISGSNFNTTPAQNIVFFGATKAVVAAATASSLTVTVPAGANYQYISVTNLAGHVTAYSQKPFIVTLNGAIAFKQKVNFTTGTTPYATLSGDFDADGKPDAAVVNIGSANISVYHNISSGNIIQFDNKIDLTSNGNPVDATTADLDGDGKPDIASTTINGSLYGGDIDLFLNTSPGIGNISFAAAFRLTGYYDSTYAIAINDIDGDGKPDIVFTNHKLNLLSIYRNTSVPGTLSFDTRIDMTGGSASRSIKFGDIDGDGKPDIILSTDAQVFQVYLNRSTPGAISLAPKVNVVTGSGSYALCIGDIDGDGKPDVAVVNEASNTLAVHLNRSTTGSVSFAARVDYTLDGAPQGITLGDIDGDGKIDIAVTSSAGNTMSVFRNTSTISSLNLAKTSFATGATPRGIVFGDINGDDKPDLAVINYGDNTVSVFQQDCVSPDMPTLQSSSTNNCGTQNTTLSIASGNLNNAANWQWYSGSCGGTNVGSGISINVSPTATTTYYARGEGGCVAAGCDSAATFVLTVSQPTAGSTSVTVCSTALPYNWNGTDYTTAGSYAVHLTNAAGCDSAATLVLTVNQPTSSTTPVTICSSALPYNWNGTDYTTAGSYTIHLTNATSCDSAATLVLMVNQPTISTTHVTICSSALPYNWNGTDYNAAGSYTIHLTNSAGCDSVATLALTLYASPTVTVKGNGNKTTVCYGAGRNIITTATGGTAPYQYSLDGTTWQNENTFLALAGTYLVTVKDNNGCTAATNGITIIQPAEKLAVATTQVQGSSITVTAAGGYGGYTYSYNSGVPQASPTLTGIQAGIDTIRVHDVNGCLASRLSVLTAWVAIDGSSDSVCYGAKKLITVTATGGSGPYHYSRNGTPSKKSIEVAAGTYTIMVQDAKGNTYTDDITIVQPAATIKLATAHTNVSCALNGSVTLQASGGFAGYAYSVNGSSFVKTNVFTNLAAGTYPIIVSDTLGCTINRSITINPPARACPSLKGRTEPTPTTGQMEGQLVVKVTPNPAAIEFNLQVVSGDSKKAVEMRVMDMQGRTVYQTRGSVYDTYKFGRKFAGGMYIAVVLNGDNVQRIKLVKGN